jgi:hypothetical protein
MPRGWKKFLSSVSEAQKIFIEEVAGMNKIFQILVFFSFATLFLFS